MNVEQAQQPASTSASTPHPVCAICGKPAACLGRYEDPGPDEYACDSCCAHGNEDGHCVPLPVPVIPAPAPFDRLTQTQLEVAIELALGAKNPEIAMRRCVSIKTIDTHRGAVMRLLSLKSNVKLARLALRVGLVSLDESEDL